jgi:phytoene/squalene synthetase
MRDPGFYQHHLDAVSRSFALCIPQLAPPFREQVALSYLLLRVLDTVEDAPFADKLLQQRQFEVFRGFLRKPPRRGQIDAFRAAFPVGLTDAERELLSAADALFEDAHELPALPRQAISSAVDRMAQGMAAYALRPSPLRLVDLEDLTRYCCLVAGLVGELLTTLWALGGGTPPSMLAAYRFGLFLQKINILKDQDDDEQAGRFFVPDRREVLASLKADSQGALEYLTALPRTERGYRTFCAWSLLLGASALQLLDSPRQSHRAQTLHLLDRIASDVDDDEVLRGLFAELMPPLPEVRERPPLPKPESAKRFVRILGAPLTDEELFDLGAVRTRERKAAAAGQ